VEEKRKRGTPRKFSPGRPERVRLVKLLSQGWYRKAAVRSVKVSYPTFLAELERDPDFAEEIAAAEDHARGVLEKRFYDGSGGKDGDWKAARDYLERKHEEWARKRSDAIGLRRFTRHMGTFVSGSISFIEPEKHEPFKAWLQTWLESVLNDDRND
jgi:hypothetical protein